MTRDYFDYARFGVLEDVGGSAELLSLRSKLVETFYLLTAKAWQFLLVIDI
jgi:hypothetical protein